MWHRLYEVTYLKSKSHDFNLFDNTPYLDRFRSFGLKKCVVFVVVITWLPLAFLSMFYSPESFFTDFTMYVRFLVAMPLLLLSPIIFKDKIGAIVNHFVDADIVKESEQEKFFFYIQSTMKLRDSRLAKSLIWLAVYAGVLYFTNESGPHVLSTWRAQSMNGELAFTIAGRWFTFVSQPIYSFIQIYFLYRVLLWWRFMLLVSLLDLQLRASHGDDTGGLVFLGGFIRLFKIPVFAFSVSIAAGAMNLVLYKDFALEDLKFILITLIAFCFLLFVAPLLLFVRPLVKTKNLAILSYGKLGGQQLEQFENKWLHQSKNNLKFSLLESPEFSSVTDAISVVNKVSKMRTIPFTPEVLIGFVICIIAPFLPVFSLKIPWTDLLKKLLGLIM